MAMIEMITASPKYSIAFFSVVVTLFSTLVQKYFTDQEHLKILKKRQKEIQKEIKGSKEPSLLKELNAEMLELTGKMFKSSMKPVFITMIPLLLLFVWLRGIYAPILSGWIWYYIGYSVLASIILRKALKIV